jgi:hypothetical protein
MSLVLTTRQKNIVNPYAELTFQERLGQQLGVDPYDYMSARGRFIIDAIHDSYINYQTFPNIGMEIGPESGLPDGERTITATDARAYFSLYPQNGHLGADPISGEQSMLSWSAEQAHFQLQLLVQNLQRHNVLKNYQTQTAPSAALVENEDGMEKAISQLLAIFPNHSSVYLERLRASMGLRNEPPINPDRQPLQNVSISPVTNTFIGSESNVDLFDWTQNAQPDTSQEKVYFNVVDDRFYYVVRTNITDSAELDMGWIVPEMQGTKGEEVKLRYDHMVHHGVSEILKFTGRHSVENLENIVRGGGGIEVPAYLQYDLEDGDNPRFRKYNAFSSKSPRPGSRWKFAVSVPQESITNLSIEQAISFEEFELSPYARALIIADAEKTKLTTREPRFFQNLALAQSLINVSELLEEYADTLREEGIGSVLTNGIDLEQESQKVSSFYDLFGAFYSYNQVALEDEDLVEFYFDDNFILLYICINGVAYNRGSGNRAFEPPAEGDAPTMILDAFAYLTTATFSYIYHSQQIDSEFLLSTPDTRKPWGSFVTGYTYPVPDISPEKIDQLRRSTGHLSLRNFMAEKKNIFTSLVNLSNISPEEREKLYNSRQRYVFLTNALFASGCDTAAARALKETAILIAAMEGKISMRSYLRRAIHALKNEVIEDETTKRLITEGSRGMVGDADDIGRQVKRMVESQIFCSLDVLGDIVGEAVLQSTDSQPAANQLARVVKNPPITLEFKKLPLMNKKKKAKQVYMSLVNQIIKNFFKSMLAAVAKDLVTAVAGCAPTEQEDRLDQLSAAFRRYNYGDADLNDLISGVDIVALAKEVGLVNVERQEVDGVEVVTTTDPTVPQLEEFIADVSKMVTPTELGTLLGGDGNDLLYRLIVEAVSDGLIRFRVGVEPMYEGEGEQIIQGIKNDLTRLFGFEQNTYRFIYDDINPAPYSSFEFTKEKIKEFFAAIGLALGDLESEDTSSAIAEFCDSRDPDLTTLELRLSEIQLGGQIDHVVNSKINKIQAYCDYLRNMQNMQLQLDRLLGSLPTFEWYDDILRLIASLLPWLWEMMSQWYKDTFVDDPKGVTDVTYNLYSTSLGVDLFYQSYTQMHNSLVVPNLRKTSVGRFVYDVPLRNARFSGHPSKTPANLMSRVSDGLRLPYAQYGVSGRAVSLAAQVGSYATTTAPTHLRDLWGNAVPSYNANPQLAANLYAQRSDTYVSPYLTDVQYRAPYNGFMPSVTLSVRNKEDPREPGLRIYGFKPQYRRDRDSFTEQSSYNDEDLLAAWVPEDFALEGESSVSYGLLTTTFIESGTQSLTLPNGEVLPTIPRGGRGAGLSRPQGAVQQLINSFFLQLDRLIDDTVPYSPDFKQTEIKVLANTSERVDKQIGAGYVSDEGKRRLPRYIYATNLRVFEENPDPCVTADQRADALAWLGVIQARIQQFFINVLPLARVYLTWNNLGTVKLVTDYLYRKIRLELKERNLWNPILQNIKMVEDVYGNYPPENPQIPFSDRLTPEDNLKIIIERMFVGMLDNIARSSEYVNINRSLYESYEIAGEESPIRQQYLTTLYLFFKELQARISSPDRSYGRMGLSEEEARRALSLLAQIIDDQTLSVTPFGEQIGSYYFPIGPLYATYLIFYDHSVRVGERYSDIFYRTEVEIASTDDAFLTALRGQTYTAFSAQYIGFPVAFTTYNNSNTITYYNKPQVQARIDYLNEILDDMTLVEISPAERRRLEGAESPNALRETKDQFLEVIDNGWRYVSPNGQPQAYYDALKRIFDFVYKGDGNAWTWPGNGRHRAGDAWDPSTPQNIEQWERTWSFYQRGLNPDHVIANPGQYDAETESEAWWYANVTINARTDAAARFRNLGSSGWDEFRPGPYTNGVFNDLLVSIDEMCAMSPLRLDRYVADLSGLEPFNSVDNWNNELHQRIAATTAINQLEYARSFVCLNSGPSKADVRREKNELQALITPNE